MDGREQRGTISEPQVGQRIRAARAAIGLTQDELARAVGVSRSAVAQWETQRTGQVTANLSRVAAALGVSVGALVSGAEQRHGATENATELALLRLYRECAEEDRAFLLRTARRLALQAGRDREAGKQNAE